MKLQAKKQMLTITMHEALVSGSVNIYKAEFEFDNTWDGYDKIAVFSAKNKEQSAYSVRREVLLSENSCVIPWEVLEEEGKLKIGVYGVREDKRLPTIYTDGEIILDGAEASSEGSAPTPEMVEQLLLDTKENREAAEKAVADAKADADRVSALAAEVAVNAAQTAQDASKAAKAMEAAQTAQRLAEEAQGAAEAARTAAAAAQAATEKAATDAAGAKQDAETAQKAAQDAEAAAAGSASAAANSAASASAAASAASESAAAAADSETAAKASEKTAKASETAAKASETAAAGSASAAQQSARYAAESAAVYDDVVADVTQLKQEIVDLKENGTNVKFPLTVQRESLNLYDENNVEVVSGEWWSGETVGSAVTTMRMNDNYERIDIPVNGVSSVTFSICGILGRSANLWAVHCVNKDRNLLSHTLIKASMETSKTVEVPEGTTNLLVSFINYKTMLSYDTHMMVNEGTEAQPWQGYWETVQDASGHEVIYKNDLDQYDRGYATINANMFVHGSVMNGEVVYSSNRAATPTKIVFDRDVRVTVADGYRYSFITYDADGVLQDSNFRIGQSEIKAGDKVRFVIAKTEENASEMIDVAEFAAALRIHNIADTRINALENSNTVLRDLGGKIEYVAITGNAGGLVDNCVESILLSAHCGLDAVEVDLRLAADGVPVLAHSSDISTYTDAPEGTLVSDITSAGMKEYKYDKYDYLYTYFKAPVRMITLSECITLCKRYGMRVYLDIKDDGYDHDHQTELLDAVISEAVAAGIDGSCVFVSTNQDSRLYVRKKLPHAIIGYKTYIDSETVEADLAGVSELVGNIMLQAETREGSAESVRAALTAERIAAYREKKLPIKDIDYYFTFDKPDACKSGLRYVFTFTTKNGGRTWNVIEAQSSDAAKNGAAILTTVENDNRNEYRFECDLFNGDLIRVARPLCTFESSDRQVYSAQYTDTGIDFIAESRTYSEECNVKVYINF